jgi:ATP-binding cassette, subfamily G (WHITE), member 2, SNQ2
VTGLGSASSYQPTIGSLLNPVETVRSFGQARHPHLKHILRGIEGVVRPGEMLRA